MTPSRSSTVAARSPSGVMTRRPRIAVTSPTAHPGIIGAHFAPYRAQNAPRVMGTTRLSLAHGDVGAGDARVGGVTDSGQVPVAELNGATAATAVGLQACASTRWIERMISGRPYRSMEALTAASDGVLATWAGRTSSRPWPRIRGSAPGARDTAARRPGRGRNSPGPGTPARRSRPGCWAGNAAYEERFGRVFLICATGMPAASMLAALQARLGHDPATEREVVRGELARSSRSGWPGVSSDRLSAD